VWSSPGSLGCGGRVAINRKANPSAANFNSTLPPRSPPSPRCSRFDPNPLRIGGKTNGPRLSRHSNEKLDAALPVAVQLISTRPVSFDSAPYLNALVHSSWIANATLTAVTGETLKSRPVMSNRSHGAPQPPIADPMIVPTLLRAAISRSL